MQNLVLVPSFGLLSPKRQFGISLINCHDVAVTARWPKVIKRAGLVYRLFNIIMPNMIDFKLFRI